jgi:hypothetical protein
MSLIGCIIPDVTRNNFGRGGEFFIGGKLKSQTIARVFDLKNKLIIGLVEHLIDFDSGAGRDELEPSTDFAVAFETSSYGTIVLNMPLRPKGKNSSEPFGRHMKMQTRIFNNHSKPVSIDWLYLPWV